MDILVRVQCSIRFKGLSTCATLEGLLITVHSCMDFQRALVHKLPPTDVTHVASHIRCVPAAMGFHQKLGLVLLVA